MPGRRPTPLRPVRGASLRSHSPGPATVAMASRDDVAGLPPKEVGPPIPWRPPPPPVVVVFGLHRDGAALIAARAGAGLSGGPLPATGAAARVSLAGVLWLRAGHA